MCQEAHKEMTELGADSETTKSGTAASETQQCQRTSRCAESKVHGKLPCKCSVVCVRYGTQCYVSLRAVQVQIFNQSVLSYSLPAVKMLKW